jgi:hypothetical protein
MASFMAAPEDVSNMHLSVATGRKQYPECIFRVEPPIRLDGSIRIVAHMIDNLATGHDRLPDATQH